jgi:predicted dinucleotide-binding enzyme
MKSAFTWSALGQVLAKTTSFASQEKVAVAFNSLPADDPKALNGVTQLTNEIGLEAVDTGNLSSATVC